MIAAVTLAVFAAMTAGVFLLLSRDLLRCVLGLSLMGAAVNLVVLAAGRLTTGAPPIIVQGQQVLDAAANPLPQALVLTAIVIGFSLTAFAAVLLLALHRANGAIAADALTAAEPPPRADGGPGEIPAPDASAPK